MDANVEPYDQILPLDYSIPILYEDAEILIVDKPWDIRVDGDFEVTVEKLVRQGKIAQGSTVLTGLGRQLNAFRLCNQLDYATSGVLVLGLTSKGTGRCNKLFCERKTQKVYLAVGEGLYPQLGESVRVTEKISSVPDSFCMQIDLHGKECVTDILPVKHVEMLDGRLGTLFEVNLLTGRRHQIRLHLKWLGYPIVGDVTYNKPDTDRMMLHAWKIVLPFKNKTVAVEAGVDEFFSHTRAKYC